MKKGFNNYLKIETISRTTNVESVSNAISGFIKPLDPTRADLNKIKSAVSEAITNVIDHAYPDDELGKISIHAFIFNDNVLEIKVQDWDCGIEDITKAIEPFFTTGGKENAGLGFTVMRSFMDNVSIKSKVGKGTTVTLKYHIISKTNL